jgi:uncharacterized membrane protein YeaQ/YmgE (transglycosylase-associated protein family)
MLGATLAGIAGALVGLYVRWVLGDRGYGVVADALLGVTGAIAANWAVVFVKQYVILPVRVCLKFLSPSVDRAPSRLIPQEDPSQTVGNFPGHFK